MYNGITQAQKERIAINRCNRYAIIYRNNGEVYYLSDSDYNIVYGPEDSSWGGFIWGENGHTWGASGQVTYPCIPCIHDWGETVVGQDLDSLIKSTAIPTTERRFSIIRSRSAIDIFSFIFNSVPENSIIEFYIEIDRDYILEDRLVIQGPISYSESDYVINISAVNILAAESIPTGSIDPVSGERLNIVVGDIGYVQASLNTSLGSSYTKTTSVINVGSTSVTVSDGAVLSGASSVVIDYETIPVASVSGNTVNFSSSAITGHLTDSVIYKSGSTFRYDFGPGPAQTVSNVQVSDNGEWADYSGGYTIYKDGATVYVTSSRPISKQLSNGSEHTITKTWSSTYLDTSNGAYVSNGDVYYNTSGTGYKLQAKLVDFYISRPANATFKSGFASVSFNVFNKSEAYKVYASKSVSIGSSSFPPNKSWVLKSGDRYYTSAVIHPTTGKLTIADQQSLTMTFPSGAEFDSGYGSVSSNLNYSSWGNGDYVEGYMSASLGGTSYEKGGYTNPSGSFSKTFSSLSDYQSGKNWLYPKLNTRNNYDLSFGGDIMSIYSFTLYARWYTYATASSVVYGSVSYKIFGTDYGWLVSDAGTASVSKTVNATSFNDFLPEKTEFLLYSTSRTNTAFDFKLLDITQLKLSLTYYSLDFGYPRLSPYEPSTGIRIRIGTEGENVNPIDAAISIMAKKRIQVSIDQYSSDLCRTYYDNNNFSLNGYLYGEKTILDNLVELMRQSHLYITESFGKVRFFINGFSNERSVAYISAGGETRESNSISVSHQSINSIRNRSTVLYNANAALEYASSFSISNENSINTLGIYEDSSAFELTLVDDYQFSYASANYLLNRNVYPFKIISFRELGYCYGLEIGDQVMIKSSFLPGGYAFAIIVSFSVSRPRHDGGAPIYTITAVYGGEAQGGIRYNQQVEYLSISDQGSGNVVTTGQQTETIIMQQWLAEGREAGGRWGVESEFSVWGGINCKWGEINQW